MTSRRRPLGLVALIVLATVVTIDAPARAGPPDPSCRTLWPGYEDDSPRGVCRLVETIAVDASTVNLYVQEDVAGARVPDDEVRDLTTVAVQRSFLEYTLLGVMPTQTDIAIVPTAFLPRSEDANAGLDLRGTCAVSVKAAVFEEGPQYFQQVLAHELFHCFQFKQFGTPSEVRASDAGGWWFEGSAEYFSNVVFPTHNEEYQFLPDLRALEPGQAIVDLSYENFVFFQHFANRQGNPAVVEFLSTMPASGGRRAQMAAASAWPGMDELFHDFAQAFVTNAITDTSGDTIPIRAEDSTLGRHVINHPGEVFRLDDLGKFEINRLVMTFPERREFDLELDLPAGVRTAAQEPPPRSPWEELPDPIGTCDDPQKWRFLMTTTAVGATEPAAVKVVDIVSTEDVDSSTSCCIPDAEGARETRAERRQVRIVVCGGAYTAVFRGGICYLDDGFLNVGAGWNVFDSFIEPTGPYPRGYAFILGLATPGTEAPGHPNVSIFNGSELTGEGTGATLTKSDDLLTGTFGSLDIFGTYRCPRFTPLEEVDG